MTTKQIKNYGGVLFLKSAIFLFLFFEVVFLVLETRGDFANGILFFISKQASVYFLGFLLVTFFTVFMLGRQAAFQIIVRKKNYIKIALAFSLLAIILIVFYQFLFICLLFMLEKRVSRFVGNESGFLVIAIILFIPLTILWIIAAKKMEKSLVAPSNHQLI